MIDFSKGCANITTLGGGRLYPIIRANLTRQDRRLAKREMHYHAVTHPDFVIVAAVVGPNWSVPIIMSSGLPGTPYAPCYIAAWQDEVQAALFVGVLLKECILEREQQLGERWGTKYYEQGRAFEPRCYFRL